jgi:hypothetical protein
MVPTALTFTSNPSMRNSIPTNQKFQSWSTTAPGALLPAGSGARTKTRLPVRECLRDSLGNQRNSSNERGIVC